MRKFPPEASGNSTGGLHTTLALQNSPSYLSVLGSTWADGLPSDSCQHESIVTRVSLQPELFGFPGLCRWVNVPRARGLPTQHELEPSTLSPVHPAIFQLPGPCH